MAAKDMGLSRRGAFFIGGWEYFMDHLYNIFGNAHIGYGHELHEGEFTKEDVENWGGTVNGKPGYISKHAAADLLRDDAHPVVQRIKTTIPNVELRQGQFDALASAGFNLGPYWFEQSEIPKLLKAGDYKGARKELLKYDHAIVDGAMTQIPGLTKRRAAEARLWRTGNYFLARF